MLAVIKRLTCICNLPVNGVQRQTVTKHIEKQYPQFKEGTVLNEEFINTLSDEDKAAADQINRRTEFQVLTTEYDLY